MTNWTHIIRIPPDLDAPFAERQATRVRLIRESTAIHDGARGELLLAMAEELSQADNPEDFDETLWDLYDLADEEHWLWFGP